MSLLSSLNPEQAQAVTLPNEHALILAGAGSGKTRVLTTRIAWLLETGQVSPGGILAVTFTNKAAKEMMARLSAQLPVNVRGMWIGTFHGLCNRFLRAHAQLVGLPQTFQILDSQDQLSAMKRLCKQYKIDAERFPPKELVWFVAGAKEDGLRPGDIEVREISDVYYDTGDLRLARWGCTLRERASEGWTVKIPQPSKGIVLDREEVVFSDDPGDPPAAALNLVSSLTRGAEVDVVARLRTRRLVRTWRTGDDRMIAELTDDDVHAFTIEGEPVASTICLIMGCCEPQMSVARPRELSASHTVICLSIVEVSS